MFLSNVVMFGNVLENSEVISGTLASGNVFSVGGYPMLFAVQANNGTTYSISYVFINGSGYKYYRGGTASVNFTYNDAAKTVTVSDLDNYSQIRNIRWYATI